MHALIFLNHASEMDREIMNNVNTRLFFEFVPIVCGYPMVTNVCYATIKIMLKRIPLIMKN